MLRLAYLRPAALQDVNEALDHYRTAGGVKLAEAFSESLEQALVRLGQRPGLGSPRFGHLLQLPGLRCWTLSGFPLRLFYVEERDRLDVWRLLHERRDAARQLGRGPE